MTGREWRPGDVLVTDQGTRMMVAANCRTAERGSLVAIGPDAHYWAYGSPPWKGARPLVVIDPENPHDAARLLTAYFTARGDQPPSDGEVASLQAALREFANPQPPKPDEPTGLGAVVEDAKGRAWVRTCDCGGDPDDLADWAQPHVALRAAYSDIAVVRVLSEGWSK